jgi:hypothetical protein
MGLGSFGNRAFLANPMHGNVRSRSSPCDISHTSGERTITKSPEEQGVGAVPLPFGRRESAWRSLRRLMRIYSVVKDLGRGER